MDCEAVTALYETNKLYLEDVITSIYFFVKGTKNHLYLVMFYSHCTDQLVTISRCQFNIYPFPAKYALLAVMPLPPTPYPESLSYALYERDCFFFGFFFLFGHLVVIGEADLEWS